jgi:serine/threonine-protein kinase HipA
MAYLLHSPEDRAGALGFGLSQTAPAPKRAFNQTLDLAKVQAIADIIVADDDQPDGDQHGRAAARADDDDRDHVEKLMVIGPSTGGARKADAGYLPARMIRR